MSSAKKSTSTRGAPKKASASKSALAHPPWIDMIKECIASHTEDARTGVSRPQIKKFVETKYKIEFGAAQNTQLARAITTGAEKGIFVLPKGPSGRVKLSPKSKAPDASASKEPAAKPKSSTTKKATATTAKTTRAAPKKTTTVRAAPAAEKKSATVKKPGASKLPRRRLVLLRRSLQGRKQHLRRRLPLHRNEGLLRRLPQVPPLPKPRLQQRKQLQRNRRQRPPMSSQVQLPGRSLLRDLNFFIHSFSLVLFFHL
ncbi:hypothetical protein BDQ17DRAFT_1060734 [Cyathus striatus]|nr:hypothetical protein BDQ17DRAFT_1060734 [Cyathus striatus]